MWSINDLGNFKTLELAAQDAADFYANNDQINISVDEIKIHFLNGKDVEVNPKAYGAVENYINDIINAINADAASEEKVRSVPYYQ